MKTITFTSTLKHIDYLAILKDSVSFFLYIQSMEMEVQDVFMYNDENCYYLSLCRRRMYICVLSIYLRKFYATLTRHSTFHASIQHFPAIYNPTTVFSSFSSSIFQTPTTTSTFLFILQHFPAFHNSPTVFSSSQFQHLPSSLPFITPLLIFPNTTSTELLIKTLLLHSLGLQLP